MVSRIACLAAVGLTVSVLAVPAARMDRSRLLIGAYCFKEVVHDEAHVRDAKECGIDFVLGVNATDRWSWVDMPWPWQREGDYKQPRGDK